MAISTQDPLLAKRRAFSFPLKPKTRRQLQMLFEFFAQNYPGGGPKNLQVVPFSALSSGETVIADAACTLYAIFAQKATATATFTKLTDHASTSSDTAAEFVLKQVGADTEMCLIFPDGLALANGATMQGNTTADAGTGSSTNGANGFVIIGDA